MGRNRPCRRHIPPSGAGSRPSRPRSAVAGRPLPARRAGLRSARKCGRPGRTGLAAVRRTHGDVPLRASGAAVTRSETATPAYLGSSPGPRLVTALLVDLLQVTRAALPQAKAEQQWLSRSFSPDAAERHAGLVPLASTSNRDGYSCHRVVKFRDCPNGHGGLFPPTRPPSKSSSRPGISAERRGVPTALDSFSPTKANNSWQYRHQKKRTTFLIRCSATCGPPSLFCAGALLTHAADSCCPLHHGSGR